MEGNNLEKTYNHEKEGGVKITLFRHGVAKYNQEAVDLEDADDLKEEGKEEVIEKVNKLSEEMDSDEEVVIWSSPTGRTLETAKIIYEVLKEKGFDIRIRNDDEGAEGGIRVFKSFEEVRGLDFKLLKSLAKGGSFTLKDGSKFVFDKNITNPDDLSVGEYYYSDKYQDVIRDENVPVEIKEKLEELEPYSDLRYRVDKNIDRLKKISDDKKIRVVIVTHHACIDEYSKDKIKPSDFVNLN